MTPSTEWKEVIAPDEGVVFERLAQDLAGVQAAVAARRGSQHRALHAKSNVNARAELEVLAGIPAHARVGMFAEPKKDVTQLQLRSSPAFQRARFACRDRYHAPVRKFHQKVERGLW